jgi:hypothetical protein
LNAVRRWKPSREIPSANFITRHFASRALKTNRDDARWLRLTDRNVGDGNSWLWTMPELWFAGAAMICGAISSLLT